MKIWPRLPSVLMVVLALAVGSVFLPSLSGCAAQDNTTVSRWMSSITGAYNFDDQTEHELARFQKAYYAKSTVDEEARDKEFKQFLDAFKVIRASYVKEVSETDLISFAVEGLNDQDIEWLNMDDGSPKGRATPAKTVEQALNTMLARLDPHSGYLNVEQFQDLMEQTSGEFGGLGIEVQQGDGFLRVVSPIEGTPADAAGLQPEDKITHVDGVSIEDWTLTKTVRHLRGKPGTDVTVTVQRAELVPFDVTITRDIIEVRAVRSEIYDDYLHLRITAFSDRMEEDVFEAFEQARREVGNNLKGVVLDLRNNPGGLLQQSIALTDMFLDEGKVVSIRGRKVGETRTYNSSSGDLAKGLPVLVLINEGSASASEIVSGALQDHDRAILMGRRTFGKGSVQTIIPLIREGAVRLTTALYYLPSGRTIQKVGVAPDITLDAPTPEPVAQEEGLENTENSEEPPASFGIQREADYPNVLDARILEIQENKHSKEGLLGHAQADACPEIGVRKDRELGCALEFLKAGNAKQFLAGLDQAEKG